MINRPKQKGTAFETAVKNFYNAHGYSFERYALHGAQDIGDLVDKDNHIVIECKAYSKFSPCHLKRWLLETKKERANAQKYFGGEGWRGYLVIKNVGFGIDKAFAVGPDTLVAGFLNGTNATARANFFLVELQKKLAKIDWGE